MKRGVKLAPAIAKLGFTVFGGPVAGVVETAALAKEAGGLLGKMFGRANKQEDKAPNQFRDLLEMSQNSSRMNWTREKVDSKLQNIMEDIHESCVRYGNQGGYTDYVKGANIAGFVKVADAMLDQGIV